MAKAKVNKLKGMTLDIMCDEIFTDEVDDHHNECNDGKLAGVLGWWLVGDSEQGGIAYFAHKTDAFRFRLDLINQKLNPLHTEEDG